MTRTAGGRTPRGARESFLAAALAWLLIACGSSAGTVEGALSDAASAVASSDYAALFQVLDERARHSLSSVYRARTLAAKTIRESYPPEAQAAALDELGDAVQASDAVDLFRRRCPERCLSAIAATLGAPAQVESAGRLVKVRTVRGVDLELYRGDDGRHGLVWQSTALVRERTRAAAELDLIQKNAAKYRAQQKLIEGSK